MRILITGTSGQLGSALARRLASEHTIVGLDVSPGEHTTWVGSVADRGLVFALMQGVDAVIHTASLHAPHVGQRTREEFIATNIQGTLHVLEAAAAARVMRVVYTSTTSLYGHALVPAGRAVWVTEALTPRPRDIYDVTKLAAEQLCESLSTEVPVVCLRTSRFWNEPPHLRAMYRLYRGVDVEDAVDAHILALHWQGARFGLFNISAASPFAERDTEQLLDDARAVIRGYYPEAEAIFGQHGWALPEHIDRVYVIASAQQALGYAPRRNFGEVLQRLQSAQAL